MTILQDGSELPSNHNPGRDYLMADAYVNLGWRVENGKALDFVGGYSRLFY
jgi:hypothetical protein